MNSPKYFAIVNPASGNGSTVDKWESIKDLFRQRLGEFDSFLTTKPGDAVEFAEKSNLSSEDILIIVGGDGTLNEVINGLLSEKRSTPIPKLAVISTGRGSDYVRTLGVPEDIRTNVDHIKDGRTKFIDVGIVEFKNAMGATQKKFLVNGSSIGMGGFVARRLQRRSSHLPSRFIYLTTTIESIMSYKPQEVKVFVDGALFYEGKCVNAFVCNGRYSGGGMHWAPQAQLDDGNLDLVLVGDVPLPRLLKSTLKLYDGSIQTVKGVRHKASSRISIQSQTSQTLEIDGECFDVMEAHFSVRPQSLRIII